MFIVNRPTLSTLALFTLVLMNIGMALPAYSQAPHSHPPHTHPHPLHLVRIYGQVVAITKDQTMPAGVESFVLQLPKGRDVMVEVEPKTVFAPRTANAEVAGFTLKDYAYVVGQIVRHMVIAFKVDFDTAPFNPFLQRIFTGQFLRYEPDNDNVLIISLGTGRVLRVYTNTQTGWSVNGQAVEVPPMLSPGDHLKIYAERHGLRWVAISIDVQTANGRVFIGQFFGYSAHGDALIIALGGGRMAQVYANARTTWLINGQAATVPPTLQPGNVLKVYAARHGARWVAIAIDMQVITSSSNP
jgi:hypothetical protein